MNEYQLFLAKCHTTIALEFVCYQPIVLGQTVEEVLCCQLLCNNGVPPFVDLLLVFLQPAITGNNVWTPFTLHHVTASPWVRRHLVEWHD